MLWAVVIVVFVAVFVAFAFAVAAMYRRSVVVENVNAVMTRKESIVFGEEFASGATGEEVPSYPYGQNGLRRQDSLVLEDSAYVDGIENPSGMERKGSLTLFDPAYIDSVESPSKVEGSSHQGRDTHRNPAALNRSVSTSSRIAWGEAGNAGSTSPGPSLERDQAVDHIAGAVRGWGDDTSPSNARRMVRHGSKVSVVSVLSGFDHGATATDDDLTASKEPAYFFVRPPTPNAPDYGDEDAAAPQTLRKTTSVLSFV